MQHALSRSLRKPEFGPVRLQAMRHPGTCCSLVTHSPDQVDKTPRPCSAPSQVTCLAGELTRRSASQRLIASSVSRCLGSDCSRGDVWRDTCIFGAESTRIVSLHVLHVKDQLCPGVQLPEEEINEVTPQGTRQPDSAWQHGHPVTPGLSRRFVRDTEPLPRLQLSWLVYPSRGVRHPSPSLPRHRSGHRPGTGAESMSWWSFAASLSTSLELQSSFGESRPDSQGRSNCAPGIVSHPCTAVSRPQIP